MHNTHYTDVIVSLLTLNQLLELSTMSATSFTLELNTKPKDKHHNVVITQERNISDYLVYIHIYSFSFSGLLDYYLLTYLRAPDVTRSTRNI